MVCWKSLYKSRIRESDQLKTLVELYDMDIHQKISMPNYQKLKTMVKRSIDQKLRLRNFDARRGTMESGAVMKNEVEVCRGREVSEAKVTMGPIFDNRAVII